MKFTQSHEWAYLLESNIAVIGISDYAQKELGDIVYVELPKVGYTVKAGDQVAVLESTKAAADVYSPLSGEVVETNLSLKESPELVNQMAEKTDSGGWLCKIKLTSPAEYEKLMDKTSYLSFIAADLS